MSPSEAGVPYDAIGSVPAPPGTSLGQMAAQGLFAEISDALHLTPLGIFTPWASRTGDLDWEEIPHPDTNVMAWALTDDQIAAAQQVTFGAPIPFVAVLSKRAMTSTAVASMWEGTAYSPYETQAVYRQDDREPVPTIYYLHWGERIDMAALPKRVLAIGPRAADMGGALRIDMAALPKRVLAIGPRAADMGGALVFAAQIPSQGSTTRPAPSVSYASASSAAMLAASAPGPALAPPVPGAEAAAVGGGAEGGSRLVLPIAIGLGAGALAFALWRYTR